MGLLSHSNGKNQLHYLLVTPFAVGCSGRVNKAAALTHLALGWIIGSELGSTLRAEQGIRVGCITAVGALIGPKLGPTAFAKTRIGFVQCAAYCTFHRMLPSTAKVLDDSAFYLRQYLQSIIQEYSCGSHLFLVVSPPLSVAQS
jgi:hypothetical protein